MATLAEIINAANVGEDVDISEYTVYTKIVFTPECWGEGKHGFSYRLETRRNGRWIYPEKGKFEVRFWRTLGGAKRYFLKMYDRNSPPLTRARGEQRSQHDGHRQLDGRQN